jgi:hypothetical protein
MPIAMTGELKHNWKSAGWSPKNCFGREIQNTMTTASEGDSQMWTFSNHRRGELSTWRPWSVAALPVITLASLVGCGGSAPPKVAVQEEVPGKPAARVEQVAAAAPAEKATKKKENEIPFDAFFDNPLEVAATQGATTVAGPAKEPAGDMEKPPANAPKAAGGATAWTEILPAEELQSEMKKLQNRLKASLQSQGTYNGKYKDIAVDGAVIAGLTGIAIEHSGEFPWKKNAPLIRDYGFELSQAATGLGKDNYEKSKAAYEKLESVFSGAIPPGAPTPAPQRPFGETADRTGLMKRIELARNHLRDNINTEAKLKSETESVVHETLIISSLGKVISTEGYSSADEQEYQQFAESLIGGAKDATAAAKDMSFEKFQNAMNKVNKSCDQCHASYGNG